jgi:hypothetical protein
MHTFELVFEYDRGKPMSFKHQIDEGEYDQFYDNVQYFFDTELDGWDVDVVRKTYPEMKINDWTTLRDIFERDFVVGGVKKIGKNKYKILWST